MFWYEDEEEVQKLAHWLIDNDKLEQPEVGNKFTAFDNGSIAMLYYFENPMKWRKEYEEMMFEEEGSYEGGGLSSIHADNAHRMEQAKRLK